MVRVLNVGIIGTGGILWAYADGCRQFDILNVAACADVDRQRAEVKATEFKIPRVLTVDELLTDPSIDLVINLTPPKAHAQVALAAIAAGKHVYNEKPLGITRAEGQAILKAADAASIRVGAAPDTFLGGGLQTARKLIDDGWIGQPVVATAFVAGRGPEGWHPNPDFFYQKGGGPLFDMGPYYITALLHLLGPVRRVTASAQKSFAERIAASEGNRGRRIPVEVPTHVAGVLDFTNGVVATLIASFDVWSNNLPRIEIYGSEGSISVPDPNGFGGEVKVRRAGQDQWLSVPLTHDPTVQRGIGPADMAYAIQSGRPHRASGELAYHALDIMEAMEEASLNNQHIFLQSTAQQPAPLPLGLMKGMLDA
ncbi:MAG: Gfo/Idh/MocA family oxidoreductase [Anaerolineae bacterium]|nr:Gfo/Idh/MocA family oxidoreductase [Anaerolineae bacterium]